MFAQGIGVCVWIGDGCVWAGDRCVCVVICVGRGWVYVCWHEMGMYVGVCMWVYVCAREGIVYVGMCVGRGWECVWAGDGNVCGQGMVMCVGMGWVCM